MPGPPVPDPFDGATHVFVVVRLTVDQHGQLKYGEVVDGLARSWGRFNTWCGMIRGMRAYLMSFATVTTVNEP